MAEKLTTRTDHSRSLEDADRYRAIEILKDLGLLISLAEIETYHGRASSDQEVNEWKVDPTFANGSNDSGNHNVNSRPTLYTGEQQVAKDFAIQRAREIIRPKYNKLFEDRVRNYTSKERLEWLDRENKLVAQKREHKARGDYVRGRIEDYTLDDLDARLYAEVRRLQDSMPIEEKEALWNSIAQDYSADVHEIVSHDTDATVLNSSFDDSELDDKSKAKYRKALSALILRITEGSPVIWDQRNDTAPFMRVLLNANKHLVTQADVKQMAAEAGVDESVALQLAGAYNSRSLASVRPGYLVNQLIRHSEDIITVNQIVNGELETFPLNLEYVQRYLREAHIVGVKQNISSATLGKDITSVSFFDLEKTTTDTGLKAERESTWQKLGSIARSMDEVIHPKVEHKEPLLRMLEDVHAKPKKLVEAARLVDGYDEIFDGDTGNWERFTLAEHTETVLRNFDETFADNLPVELIAPMRLAILVHDMGKPLASSRGEKHRQKQYNVSQANDFLEKLGVDERLKKLLIAVIGDGEELAFDIEIRDRGEPAKKAMRDFAVQSLRAFNNSEKITEEQINGFIEMCKMLQICDGGAYTSMAVTSRSNGEGNHRNAPSFNRSFKNPLGSESDP